jgi:hypothetical protein
MVSQQRPQQEGHVVAQSAGGKLLCLNYEYWVRPHLAEPTFVAAYAMRLRRKKEALKKQRWPLNLNSEHGETWFMHGDAALAYLRTKTPVSKSTPYETKNATLTRRAPLVRCLSLAIRSWY